MKTVGRGALQGRLLGATAAHGVRVGYDLVGDVGVAAPGLLIEAEDCGDSRRSSMELCRPDQALQVDAASSETFWLHAEGPLVNPKSR